MVAPFGGVSAKKGLKTRFRGCGVKIDKNEQFADFRSDPTIEF